MRMRWPRGRYNGRRIVGFTVKVGLDVSECYSRPKFCFRLGFHYFIWLWFSVRFEAVYHFND